MKRLDVAVLIAAAAVATTAGCGKEHDENSHKDEKKRGVTYSAKRGLAVPDVTARFIGLEIVDVEERTVASVMEFSAHIYRAATEAQFVSVEARDMDNALASASLSSVEAAKLEAQQPVIAKGETKGPFPGRIIGVNRDLEKASGHVEVLLTLADPKAELARGAFVSVEAKLGGGKTVVSVPRSALLRTAEGDFVYTVSGEHYVRAQVKAGMINGEFAEITEGLYAGDRVVVKPVITLWLSELQSIRGGKACADGH